MGIELDKLEIKHNEAARRFEADLQGSLAVLEYMLVPGRMLIQHTEVPQELEGRGIAAKMTRVALEYARSQKLEVVPACSYTASFMAKHPEYNDLLPPPR
ncbi:MAG: N-acetyltransferase [Acidobacteria bacterium]|nr:N-acetyltransferase [Acidobacteriota bacterium]MBS1866520.1 N-acetyltransferase [Acidobacteriota bacterium]